jgi:hypothetical protein
MCEGEGFLEGNQITPDATLREAYNHHVFAEYHQIPRTRRGAQWRMFDEENFFVYWLAAQVCPMFGTCNSTYFGAPGTVETGHSFLHTCKQMHPLIHNVDLFKLFTIDDRVREAQGKFKHKHGDTDDFAEINGGMRVDRFVHFSTFEDAEAVLDRQLYTNVDGRVYLEPGELPDVYSAEQENVFKILQQCYPCPPARDMNMYDGAGPLGDDHPVINPRIEGGNAIVVQAQHDYSLSLNVNTEQHMRAFTERIAEDICVRRDTGERFSPAPAECVLMRTFHFTNYYPHTQWEQETLDNILIVYYNYLREYIRAEMVVRYIFLLQLIDRAADNTYGSGFRFAREVRLCIKNVLERGVEKKPMFGRAYTSAEFGQRGFRMSNWVQANQEGFGDAAETYAQRRVLCFCIWRNLWHFNELYKDRYGENIVDTVLNIDESTYVDDSLDEWDDDVPIYLYKNIMFGYTRAMSLMSLDPYMANFAGVFGIHIIVDSHINYEKSPYHNQLHLWQLENFFKTLRVAKAEYVQLDEPYKRQRIEYEFYTQQFLYEPDGFLKRVYQRYIRELTSATRAIIPGVHVEHLTETLMPPTTQLKDLLMKDWLVPIIHVVDTMEDLL